MRKLFTRSNFLYLITDRAVSGLTHEQTARRAVSAGIRTIQLREKEMPKKDIFKSAVFIRALTAKQKITFIVNDYIDVAMAVNADGVHLGQEDMPVKEARSIAGKKMIIGISTHSLTQALRAQEEGADYIGFGPLFHTGTKDAGRPRGLRTLREIRKYVTIPIVAIGGITWDNVHEVLHAGADAVAVISGVLSGNIRKNTGMFFKAVR